MYYCMTETGIYGISLEQIKFHNQTHGWICGTGNNLFNVVMLTGNRESSFISNTICGTLEKYGFNDFKQQTNFRTNKSLCPIKNCYCGMDIAIPKAITEDHLEIFIDNFLSSNKKNIKEYTSGKILAFGNEIFLTQKITHVDWFLGKRCNYDCSYCPATIHDNFSPYADFTMFKEYFDELNKKLPKNKTIQFQLHGGEPTIIPDYLKFLEYIKENIQDSKIRTLTNFTASIPKLIEIHKLSDITFSVHLKYFNQKSLKKLKEFLIERDKQQIKSRFVIKIMHDIQHADKIDSIQQELKSFPQIQCIVTALHDKKTKKLLNYSDADKKRFK